MAMLSSLVALAVGQTLAKTVEVPFKIGEDAIIADLEVNGRKASLMFDTGFSGAVLIDDGINIGKPSGYMTLRDFVGEFQAPIVDIKSLKLGAKVIDPTGMKAVQQPAKQFSMSYNTNCSGIMGLEVVRKYVTEINFENSKFIFHPNTVDISKRVPDNKRTFLARLLPKGNGSLEMAVEAANGRKMTLALDTGNAFFATTHRDVLERIGLWETGKDAKFMRSSWVASGEVPSFDLNMKNIKIFGVPVESSVWSIIDLPASSAEGDGTIGYGFLKNFNIIIDYERRRVWLENFTGKTGNELEGSIGVSAFPNPNDNNRTVVVRVAPESPAAKAGLKVGDVILSIDGVELLDIGFRRLDSLMKGPKGSKMKLVTSRRGQLIRYEVERDLLVNDTKPH